MNPEDRLEARVRDSVIPELLKRDILDKLEWYKIALYHSSKENRRLEKQVSDYRWKDTPQQGAY